MKKGREGGTTKDKTTKQKEKESNKMKKAKKDTLNEIRERSKIYDKGKKISALNFVKIRFYLFYLSADDSVSG